jgi:hypothetical protein
VPFLLLYTIATRSSTAPDLGQQGLRPSRGTCGGKANGTCSSQVRSDQPPVSSSLDTQYFSFVFSIGKVPMGLRRVHHRVPGPGRYIRFGLGSPIGQHAPIGQEFCDDHSGFTCRSRGAVVALSDGRGKEEFLHSGSDHGDDHSQNFLEVQGEGLITIAPLPPAVSAS